MAAVLPFPSANDRHVLRQACELAKEHGLSPAQQQRMKTRFLRALAPGQSNWPAVKAAREVLHENGPLQRAPSTGPEVA